MSQLSSERKAGLKQAADQHLQQLFTQVDAMIATAQERIGVNKELADQIMEYGLNSADEASTMGDLAKAKIDLYGRTITELRVVKGSPYFIRLELIWDETGEKEVMYFGKLAVPQEKVYSWVAPISTLRYGEIGAASYTKPSGEAKRATILRKDNFIITGGGIVFMTFEDDKFPRQVVFQKHFQDRAQFMLPEIVAELDRIQDQIIRSDPAGTFLISGPAGSGKTTLALHRIAYLVLTPEFKDYFDPEKIIVYVSNDSDVTYFKQLLPELGIHGVRVTTFMEWATMIANSRFPASSLERRFKGMKTEAAVEAITAYQKKQSSKTEPILSQVPARLLLDLYRRLKQDLVSNLDFPGNTPKIVHPTLHEHYQNGLTGLNADLVKGFTAFLRWQKEENVLDEVDLVIVLNSLSDPLRRFAHVVVDEVQNWLPEQLALVPQIVTPLYKSVTFIGDVRQKTKAFALKEFQDLGNELNKAELLKIYRNTFEILEYLKQRGYDVELEGVTKHGPVVRELEIHNEMEQQHVLNKLFAEFPTGTIGILAKYSSSLSGLTQFNYDENSRVKVMTVESAQGLEFDHVLLLDVQDFDVNKEAVGKLLGTTAAIEFTDQAKHLFYVACTRAKESLTILRSNDTR
jgi:DNA helicase IV